MTLHKAVGEDNLHVWFKNSSQKKFNDTRGQGLGSINVDTLNAMNTSQQSTKDGFYEELEGYIISSKVTNLH